MATDTYYNAARHQSPNSDPDDEDLNSNNSQQSQPENNSTLHNDENDFVLDNDSNSENENNNNDDRHQLNSPQQQSRSPSPHHLSRSPSQSPRHSLSQSPRRRSPSQSPRRRSPYTSPRRSPRYDDDDDRNSPRHSPRRHYSDEDVDIVSRIHSINGARRSGRRSDDDDDNSGSSQHSADDDSSYQKDDIEQDDDDDDDVDHIRQVNGVGRGSRSSRKRITHNDVDVDDDLDDQPNGNSHQSDSDDHSQQPTRRRSRPSEKFIIPDEMRDDKAYFRRSSRSRSAPNRYSSPGSGSDSDRDFNDDDEEKRFEVEDEEEEEMEEEDDDDEDYNLTPPPRSRRSTRSKQPGQGPSHEKGSDEDGPAVAPEQLLSESGSDEDWRVAVADGAKRPPGRRRRRKKSHASPSKRQRSRDSEEEALRAARSNSRGGQAVNYFESDDGEFLASDAEAGGENAIGGVDYLVNLNEPHVESVMDYRVGEDIENVVKSTCDGSGSKTAAPYSDFKVDDVEFLIKWMSLSYRKCTWESWDSLKTTKGAKRVGHFIKRVEGARDNYTREGVTPEEIEDVRVLREEQRALYREYEIAERVIAKRDNAEDESKTEYLVKWTKLPYLDATWEDRADLTSTADIGAIDAFMERETNVLSQGSKKKYNPFNTKDDRPKFKKMTEQPDFLQGEGRTLRDYQLAGLNYMAFSWTKRNNVILADEMGLGKTLQSISFLGWMQYIVGIPGQFLVVVPLSTIEGWRREFMRWVPNMNVVVYTGNGPSRKMIRDYEFYSTEKKVEKFHVLLTTPELVMADQDYLMDIRWAIVAVDEAHRLKNELSSLHITLASLKSANRLLITGTPLQNSIRELWALLHFLNPDIFASAEEFEDLFSFSALRDPDRVGQLHITLRPYIIRRQKGDVEKSLPKKTYSVLRVGMTSSQQQYYRWLLTRNFAKLNASGKGRGMGPAQNIRNLLMELKKCCNHPFLFPNYEDTTTTTTVNDLTRASGKMILLDKLLLRLKEKGHRVLIFSQMVRMLDILQDYCRMRQFACQRLDGSIENEIRQRAVDHFNAPDSTDFIFLLSTRAGGLGINLATADTVIIFDSDWNPQNDLQAESRAHRIGQKKDVKVFRFLTAETVEEDILERAKRKRVLEHVVIHGVEGGHKAEGKEKEMTFKKEELSAILRFGAEKLFAKDRLQAGGLDTGAGKGTPSTTAGEGGANTGAAGENEESDAPTGKPATTDEKDVKAEEKRVLAADDIDEILNRAPEDESSQVGAAQPSIGDSLLNAFKWADFTVEEEDMEDPNDLGVDDDENGTDPNEMARQAASKIVDIDREVQTAKQLEEQERQLLTKEGDSDFWNRVIPGDLKEGAIANDVILGTRRRKRPSTFNTGGIDDSPEPSKRRRTTRNGRAINGRGGVTTATEEGELNAKEQRSLLRSLRRFGDPTMASKILADAGLEDRIDIDVATALINDCLERARISIKKARDSGWPGPLSVVAGGKGRGAGGRVDDDDGDGDDDEDPSYGGGGGGGGRGSGKSSRITVDVLGEKGVDAIDLLKRCDELMMLRRHLQSFESDLHFRFKDTIKQPSYGTIRWKASFDAMLLIGVCRHGFGNWVLIAKDPELDLEDKIAVSGNLNAKPGAPDSTKLARRIVTLLRELEKEVTPPRNGVGAASSKGKGKGKGKGKTRGGIKGDGRISKESTRGRSRHSARWNSGTSAEHAIKVTGGGSSSRRDGRMKIRGNSHDYADNADDFEDVHVPKMNVSKSKSAKGSMASKAVKTGAGMSKGKKGVGKGKGRGNLNGGPKSGGGGRNGIGASSSDGYKVKRLSLKGSHLKTLRELLSLSKTDSTVETNEKIKRTKQCLLILGRGIEEHAGRSKAVEVDLWKYVHTVCKTQLAEDRLQAIYKRLAEAEEEK